MGFTVTIGWLLYFCQCACQKDRLAYIPVNMVVPISLLMHRCFYSNTTRYVACSAKSCIPRFVNILWKIFTRFTGAMENHVCRCSFRRGCDKDKGKLGKGFHFQVGLEGTTLASQGDTEPEGENSRSDHRQLNLHLRNIDFTKFSV